MPAPLLFVIAQSLVTFARAATLTGHVADSESGRPIPYVQVVLPDLEQTALSDLHGGFSFEHLPRGRWPYRVSRFGYRSHLDTLNVDERDSLSRFILLDPLPFISDPPPADLEDILRGLFDRTHAQIVHSSYADLQTYRCKIHGKQILYAGSTPESGVTGRIEFTGELYYRKPDTFVQVITGYRAHGMAGRGFGMHPGVIVGIRRGRLNGRTFDVGELPLEPRAEDRYRYRYEDRIRVGDHPIHHLRVDPRSRRRPGLEGDLWVSGHGFDLVGYDLKFSRRLLKDLLIRRLRTYQECGLYLDRYWLPIRQIVEIETGDKRLAEQVTYLDGYDLNVEIDASVFDLAPLSFHPDARNRSLRFWTHLADSLRASERRALRNLTQNTGLPEGWKRLLEMDNP